MAPNSETVPPLDDSDHEIDAPSTTPPAIAIPRIGGVVNGVA